MTDSRQSLKQGWNQRLQIRTSCCPALLEPKAADDIRPPTTRVARAASATDEHLHAPWIRGSAQWTIASGSVVIGDEGRLASTGVRGCFLILSRLTLLLRPIERSTRRCEKSNRLRRTGDWFAGT